MSNNIDVTCSNCYFHGAGLCALRCDEPCPTFRFSIQVSQLPSRPSSRHATHPLAELTREHAVA